jgi:hypothetical protein
MAAAIEIMVMVGVMVIATMMMTAIAGDRIDTTMTMIDSRV